MLKFGFKKLIEEKNKALFSFPHLVVGAKPTEPKRATKFTLVNARDLLKFNIRDNKISWFYDETGDSIFYIININGVDAEPSIEVTLSLEFSNKNLYDKLIKILDLDSTIPHYFQLIETTIQGLPAAKLVKIDLGTIENPEPDPEAVRAVSTEIDVINENITN